MKIKNMKQVKEHMKDMNMKRLFRRELDHHYHTGRDDCSGRIPELRR